MARPRRARRRALMLVVVLVMVVLLALLAASYTFMANANLSTVMADHLHMQVRMAAESGVQRAIVLLTRDPEDPGYVDDLNLWFDNPDDFRAALVYSVDGSEEGEVFRDLTDEETDQDVTYDPFAEPKLRFSLIAPNYDDPRTVRYGITDECSKLDLNRATASQLRALFEAVIPDDPDNEVDLDMLVDSLLDWREAGGTARAKGAKDAFYMSLIPPYRCKKAPFSTVEELLLVRGFTGWVVFGEDYNRNGLLDPYEDDDDETFPLDNADGELMPGIAPFLTVWSREPNTANDNRARINLNMQDLEKLQEDMAEHFDGNIISYVMDVRAAGKTFNSVMNLLPAPPPPEEDEEEFEEDETAEPAQADEEDPSSQPEDENAAESGEDSSDDLQTVVASENQRQVTPAASRPVYQDLTDEEPPGSYEDLPLILNRLTVQQVPMFAGRINVSTAPYEVLATIEELTEEELEAIVAVRQEAMGEELATPAWLLTLDALGEYKFRQVLDKITTKSSVYRIESVGFADHYGVVTRMNVVLEMRGPIAQVLYRRNLDPLGPAYTPHGEERRRLEDGSD